MAPEPVFTRYRILTSDDNMVTWTYVTTVEATNRDTALRKHFANPPAVEVLAVAVAESSFRPQTVVSKVTSTLTEQPLPGDVVAVATEQPSPGTENIVETELSQESFEQAEAAFAGGVPVEPEPVA